MSKYIIGLLVGACLLGETAMAETIEVIVGDKTYPVEMQDHDAAKDFIKRLPMTLTFENFGNTERIAEIRGRNERILSERPPREGSPLPQLSGIGGGENPDEGRSTAFGFRRRGSVWDL